jgi:hypothetical protein
VISSFDESSLDSTEGPIESPAVLSVLDSFILLKALIRAGRIGGFFCFIAQWSKLNFFSFLGENISDLFTCVTVRLNLGVRGYAPTKVESGITFTTLRLNLGVLGDDSLLCVLFSFRLGESDMRVLGNSVVLGVVHVCSCDGD